MVANERSDRSSGRSATIATAYACSGSDIDASHSHSRHLASSASARTWLITGTSAGFGKPSPKQRWRRDDVVATARHVEALEPLAATRA